MPATTPAPLPRPASSAGRACRCETLRTRADFADRHDFDGFAAALARDPELLAAPPAVGVPDVGLAVRRLRCATCGSAWRLAEPDPPLRGAWQREAPSGFDPLAGDLAALDAVLRREGGASLLPGVRELRRLVESLAAEGRSTDDLEARRALHEAAGMLARMFAHKEGLADFHVWRDDFEARRRENAAFEALSRRLQQRLAALVNDRVDPADAAAAPRAPR